MSRIKNEFFDEITFRMELTKLYKELQSYPVKEDFSPILLAQEFYGKFNLDNDDVLTAIRVYYNF